ncbi:MAG TPA: SRPBCC family protein [Devosia sp.]|nr:SRPBCC family protein [Devosia sp.]
MGFAGPLTVTTPSEREIVITRQFDAPRHLVFACYTQPALIRRWLNGAPGWTMPVCEFEPRTGGKYRYEWQSPEGTIMGMGGVIREIEPVERIVTSELFDEDWTGGETISTIILTEANARTTLTNTIVYSSRQARDGALASPMADGMEFSFSKLDTVLAEGAA